MVGRLAEDHQNAHNLAIGLAEVPGINLNPEDVETNQVYFNVNLINQSEILDELENNGVRGLILDEGWRFVTHYGITEEDIDWALSIIDKTFKKFV
jgi:threonine aldolase